MTLLHLWQQLLSSINRVQKRLQSADMDFHNAAIDIQSLQDELGRIRETLCYESIAFGKRKCEEWGVEIDKRIRRKKRLAGEISRDSGLTAEEELVRVIKSAMDRLQLEMTTRFKRLTDMNDKFGFLLSFQKLFGTENMPDSVLQSCIKMEKFYGSDVSGKELFCEICDCRMLLNLRKDIMPKTPLELLKFLISYGDDVFPNFRIALQLLLTVCTSIASCERSFSKLKLVLSYLRATMTQQRLNDLALLSIERDIFNSLDFDDIIDKFAMQKARKIDLL